MYSAQQARIPYYSFYDVEMGEDFEKSKQLGYAVPRMVTMIKILPHGQRGEIEFIADEYIARKEVEAQKGSFDKSWVQEFKHGLEEYRNGRSAPRSGTPLITYERILKSRRETLAKMFPTVEDLAAVPDSDLGSIGLDGRVIRDMARLDIQAKKDMSPIVHELADANETIRRQQDQIDRMTARLEKLESKQKRTKEEVE
jgi:uncharacterized coiled-coil protein SlyX